MNQTIILPETDLSMIEWFIKHKVSSKVCSLDYAISRAINSQVKL